MMVNPVLTALALLCVVVTAIPSYASMELDVVI
jgi:hypothetical protein